MKKVIDSAISQAKKQKAFILYILIGFTGLALDLISFVFMIRVLKMNELIANPISMTVGIVNNFLWNAFLNFKKTDRLLSRFMSFYAVGLFGIMIGNFFLWFFNGVIGVQVGQLLGFFSGILVKFQLEIVKAVSIVVIAIIQFFLNKRFSFKS